MNNTICNNKAATYGGGLYVKGWKTYAFNNIIWGNTASLAGSEQIYDPQDSLIVQYCNVQGGWPDGENILDDDPLFHSDTFELHEDSPCIDAGINSVSINGQVVSCPQQDFWGHPRPWSPNGDSQIADIGAYELYGTEILIEMPATPRGFNLLQNYPNPFNPITAISYQLSAVSWVELDIYDVMGRKIKTLVDEEQGAGMHQVEWETRDAFGRKVSSGIYLYRIQVFDKAGRKAYSKAHRMLLLK